MRPTLIKNASHIVGEEQLDVEGLPVEAVYVDFPHAGRKPGMVSEWVLTAADRDMIAAGGSIYLTVIASQHPTVMLEVGVPSVPEPVGEPQI